MTTTGPAYAGGPVCTGRTMIKAVSFSAARDLDDGGREVVINVLTTMVPTAERYITGGAIGGDAFIGRWLCENRPWVEHQVIVPADKKQVAPWWLTVSGPMPEIVLMPHGSTFKDRNGVLVAEGTMLFGFPAYPEDHIWSARSGTWQTIRMARRAHKLSQWHCVKPPYKGRVEVYPSEFEMSTATPENRQA